MITYKLTDKEAYTRGCTHWTIGVMNRADGEGGLCGPGWLHCYEHPILAVLHDPIHGKFGASARMFRCEAGGQILKDGQMKMGCTELTPIEEIPLPSVTTTQRIAYAVYCAKCFHHDQEWNEWSNNWLSGEDRTFAAAKAARAAAKAAGWAAAAAAGWAAKAAQAAWEAAWEAWEAARWAAEAARASGAAAAVAAAWAAAAATAAAEAAKEAAAAVNLLSCAEKAMRIE